CTNYSLTLALPVSNPTPRIAQLLFLRYGDHRDLHSFPTRRSSDLMTRATVLQTQTASRERPLSLRATNQRYSEPTLLEERRRLRSEEHTSELQSRENLVCRLLLEKKKKKNTNQLTHKKLRYYNYVY